MSGQWIRCFLTLHKRQLYKEEPVTNFKNEIVGKNIISRCENCGKINVKYVANKLEDIKQQKF